MPGTLIRGNKVLMRNFKMKISHHLVILFDSTCTCIPILKMSSQNDTKIYNAVCLQELDDYNEYNELQFQWVPFTFFHKQ